MPYVLQNIDKEEYYKVDPIKWENINIIGFEKFWEKTDPLAAFYERQIDANTKFIKGILTDNIGLVDEALKTNLINLMAGITVITDSKNESERQQPFTFKDALYDHPIVFQHLKKTSNTALQINCSFSPPNLVAPKTELTTLPSLFGKRYLSVPKEKIEYFQTPFFVDKTKIIGIRISEGFSNLGLEEFAKGIISGNFSMVKNTMENYNINPLFVTPLVTENMNELRLNPIYEARTRGYKKIENYLIHKSLNKIAEAKRKTGRTPKETTSLREWLISSNEYTKFSSPIEWTTILGTNEPILGVRKTNLNAGRPGHMLSANESFIASKTPEQVKNEEFLIRGILTNNTNMVKIALNSKLIDKSLLISIITDNVKYRKICSFNTVQEALRKNNPEIISLLRRYQQNMELTK